MVDKAKPETGLLNAPAEGWELRLKGYNLPWVSYVLIAPQNEVSKRKYYLG
jgi:hypothetical protein